MSERTLAALQWLDVHVITRVLHYPLPIVLALALTALGWQASRGGASTVQAKHVR